MSEEIPVVGVIGGSGLYQLEGVTIVKQIEVDTPWGKPSSPITIATLPTGEPIAFLARHGTSHTLTPSEVPSRANLAALKKIGIKAIVAFSAVGSLKEEIKPRDVVIPTQIIDRTKGIRPSTFFGDGIVGHAMFGEPFSTALTSFVVSRVKAIMSPEHLAALKGAQSVPTVHTDKVVVCMEGPQFSTRAESNLYRSWGGDIINMSVLPESKLAKEAEISYALICTSTDYDAWRVSEKPVTADEVMAVLKSNAEISNALTLGVLSDVHKAVLQGDVIQGEVGTMKYAVVTKPNAIPEEKKKALAFILPEYYA